MATRPLRSLGCQLLLTAATFVGLLLQPGGGVQADDLGWIADSGNWSNASNWSLGVLPQASDTVFLTRIDSINRIVTLDVSLPPVNTLTGFLGSISIDGMGTGSMSFVQDGHDFSAGYQYVGVVGVGTFTHVSGRNSVLTSPGGTIYDITNIVQGALYLGVQSTGTGTYALSGTGTLSANATFVGYRGTGTFNQSGGTHSSSDPVYLGYSAGSHGTYLLSNGFLASGRTFVGLSGTGTFLQSGGSHSTTWLGVGDPGGTSTYTLNAGNLFSGDSFISDGSFSQTGGDHTVAGTVWLGSFIAGGGAYHMDGGNLGANSLSVGFGGHGMFSHTAGDVALIGAVSVGDFTNSPGTYELSGSGSLTAFQQSVGALATGVFNQSGGANTATSRLVLGVTTGVTGTYNLTGGNLDVKRDSVTPGSPAIGLVIVGDQGTGRFNQSGGAVRIDGPRSIDGILSLGLGGGMGSYTLGGTGTLFANEEYIGQNTGTVGGVGDFNQTGGDHTVRRNLNIGAYVTSTGSYTLSDGTLTVGAEGYSGTTRVGYSGTGTFTQTGGTHTTNLRLVLGDGTQAVGTYNLSGGLLSAPNAYVGNGGVGIFNQSGGIHNVAGSMWIANYRVFDYVANAYKLSGSYALSGGRLNSAQMYVGSVGIGEFNQTDGENVITGRLSVSSAATSSGTYNLSGGSLSAFGTHIGFVGTGIFNHSGGSHTLTDVLRLGSTPGTGTYLLSGTGMLAAAGAYVGSNGSGLFEQSGGTNTLSGNLYLGYNPGASGQYHLSDGALTAANAFLGSSTANWDGVGLFSQTGGTHTLSGTLTIAGTAQGAANPTAHGTYDLSGGVLSAAVIINYDHLNFFGGAMDAPVTNQGVFTLSGAGTRTVNGHVVNHGTVKVTDTVASFLLGLDDYGVYVSDPSENRFSDLFVRATGYLDAGAGDRFIISNDLAIESGQSALWDTGLASLEFISGADGSHVFSLPSWQMSWGTIRIDEGQVLALAAGTDLLVDTLILEPGSTFTLNGATIRCSSIDNRGFVDLSNGGQLIVVPEPSGFLLQAVGLSMMAIWAHRGRRTGVSLPKTRSAPRSRGRDGLGSTPATIPSMMGAVGVHRPSCGLCSVVSAAVEGRRTT
ncbi:MAG: hypothetical protein NTU94_03945 [Planctomycetota bacterium]|nr:hypothetical protein [Planctomycetota bacterium]